MGVVLNAGRDLGHSYGYLKAYRAVNHLGYCGFGVRERDANVAAGDSYFCSAYTPSGGSNLKYLHFYFDTIADGTQSVFIGVWDRPSGSDTITLIASYEAEKPTGNWQADTEYFVEMEDAIYLPVNSRHTYYLQIYTKAGAFYATDTGRVRGWSYGGNAIGNKELSISTELIERDYAWSFEAWGVPASYKAMSQGGTDPSVSDDWHGTEAGAVPWTDPANIEADDANVATSNGNKSSIDIDLANGQAVGTWDPADFPDYTACGIRAVQKIHFKGGVKDAAGGITILYNATDSVTSPATGWENLISYALADGAIDEDIEIPVLARWIRILESGAPAALASEAQFLEVTIILTAVSDGVFWVDHADDKHAIWVENYPTEACSYTVQAFSIEGGSGPTSDPRTNRIECD